MPDVSAMIRRFFGRDTSPPEMNPEQARIAERLRRIGQRQKAIDIQVEVLRADTADERRRK